MKQLVKKGWISTLVAAIFFIIIFFVVRNTSFFTTVSFTTSNAGMTFAGPEGGSITVPYSDVISIEYVDNPDYGNPLADVSSPDYIRIPGGTKHECRYGMWKSSSLGEYLAYNKTSIASCAIISTKSHGTIVFNYENDTTTKDFAQAYEDYCKEFQ